MSAERVDAFIGIGSNLEQPKQQVESAFVAIAGIPECQIVKVSSLYRSAPVGHSQQPDFVNAVAMVQTSLSAKALLNHLLALENLAGRVRRERWGPRVLDLDLLMYGARVRSSGVPLLPHPRMQQRAFVLVPLLEVAADIIIPGCGSAADCLRNLGPQHIERIQ